MYVHIYIFTGVQKIILMYYDLWSYVIKSILICKRFIRLGSNLECILLITVRQTLLILVRLKKVFFLTGEKK